MLRSLFARLTADPRRGAQSFAAAIALARDPAFYRDGGVADTLDGRFAMLSTVVALLLVRIERDGAAGEPLAVALSERFIEAMDAEHRQLGLSDPSLGKTVRKLVASLGSRADLWRSAVAGEMAWATAARKSVESANAGAVAAMLADLWMRIDQSSLGEIEQGRIG